MKKSYATTITPNNRNNGIFDGGAVGKIKNYLSRRTESLTQIS